MKLTLATKSKAKRILLFGAPKTGKSRLAGECAEKFKIIYVGLENGHEVLFQLPVEWQENIELINIPDTRSFPVGIETCLKMVKGQAGSVCEEHGKWNCVLCKKEFKPVVEVHLDALALDTIVIFDSISQLTNSAIAHITKHQDELYKLEYDDWANLGKLLDTFLSHIQQAGYHVICISHETETEMEDGKTKLVPTAGTRNFSRNTAKYFDEVVYCEVKNRQHKAASSTRYSGTILTGSRSGTVLENQSKPSLLPIFTGERIPEKPAISDGTPAEAAVSGLNSALERIRNKAASK